jgi:hypothetical protein
MRKKFCTISMVAFMALLLVSVGAINCASAQSVERISWGMVVEPTVDGMWTSPDEWTDGGDVTTIGEDVSFTSTWYYGADDVSTHWLVEFISDTTEDAEDYWEFCMDGMADGGSAPSAGDFKFVITGHTDLVWYEGDGTGWAVADLDESEIEWANALSESPTDSTEHWILEFVIGKNTGTVQLTIMWNCRLAVYDASNSEAGELAWPPDSDADDPTTYGIENYTSETIPEGLSLGVLVLLSSAAVVVATVVLRKRSKK